MPEKSNWIIQHEGKSLLGKQEYGMEKSNKPSSAEHSIHTYKEERGKQGENLKNKHVA